MTHLWNEYLATLPASLREWMRGLLPLLQILLIAIGAVLLQRLLRRVTNRVAERYRLPAEFNFITRRLLKRGAIFGANSLRYLSTFLFALCAKELHLRQKQPA